jgi:hypothetical protein
LKNCGLNVNVLLPLDTVTEPGPSNAWEDGATAVSVKGKTTDQDRRFSDVNVLMIFSCC